MRNTFLVVMISFFNFCGTSQTIKQISYDPITKEYFLRPLLLKHKEQNPYKEPQITQELQRKALERALGDCSRCFEYSSYLTAASQKSAAENNKFGIDFKQYITENGYTHTSKDLLESYANGATIEFKDFRKNHKEALKNSGFKKKSDQLVVYTKLLEKANDVSTKVLEYYSKMDHVVNFWETWKKKYVVLHRYKTNYSGITEDHKELIKEKLSSNFNPVDKVLVHPDLLKTTLNNESIEASKKSLIDRGWVEIKEKKIDKGTLIYPYIVDDSVRARLKILNKYFNYDNYPYMWYSATKERIVKMWYGHFENEFSLNSFDSYIGGLVSKEEFLAEKKYEKNIDTKINTFINDINKATGFYMSYNRELKIDPKKMLIKNIKDNFYKISEDEIATARKNEKEKIEVELNKKGGILRDTYYYKITPQGKFDYFYFSDKLWFERDINGSVTSGKYLKKNNASYTLKDLVDNKTGIKLPDAASKLSADGKNFYYGSDKVPYVKMPGQVFDICLLNHKHNEGSGKWVSTDGKESFGTDGVWRSSITGGISAWGDVLQIKKNKYAFLVSNTSWGGSLDNNFVLITVSDDCNTIYYGKSQKKMIFQKID
ncbi:MAG: hypothetical protein ACPHXR_01620 [Flavicella sp.]